MDANHQARPNAVWEVRESERTGQVIAGTAGVSPAMSAKRENGFSQQKPFRSQTAWTLPIFIVLSANLPRVAAIANLMIGNAYMAQGKFGNAEVAFERAVTLDPTNAESYNNLGEALGELKQYPRALETFNKAINLDPKLLKA